MHERISTDASGTYDARNRRCSRTDRKSQVTTTTYDALDRPLDTTWQGGATTTRTWDAGDRLTQIVDTVSGTITRQYDIRFDTVTQEVGPVGPATATVNTQYDAAGRRTQLQVVGQTAVTYGYDDANRLTSVTQGSNAVGFTYDAASRRTTATLPNLVSIDYGYDDANQLTSLTYKRSGATLQALAYGYDLAGRRITMSGTAARINLPPVLSSATYDANNRLTSWAGTAQTYDFNGNLTNDGVNTYTWDTRDRLTAVAGSVPLTNVYDPFNRRVSKTLSGVQSGLLYDGFSEITGFNGTVVSANFLNGLGLDERYARINNAGVTHTYLPDAVGSTTGLVASNGAITASYTYEPYGTSSKTGADDTSLRYTGRAEDTPNLMYYRARFYNPRTSRFISEDPIGLAGGYNLYAYVGGDPVSFSDPSGLAKREPPWFDTKKADSVNDRPGPSDQSGRSGRTGNPVEQGPDRPGIRDKVASTAAKALLDYLAKQVTGLPAVVSKKFIPIAIWGLTPSELACSDLDCNGNGIPDFAERQGGGCPAP